MLNRLKSLAKRVEALIWSRKRYKFLLSDWTRWPDLDVSAELFKTMRFSRSLSPLVLPPPGEKKILVVAPHPDDEAIGPGGTLIAATIRGASVTVLYVTDGTENDRSDRVRESDRVCQSKDWNHERCGALAGQIFDVETHAEHLAEIIKRTGAQILMLPFVLDDNDDHRRVNQFLLHSAFENLNSPPEVWAYQVYSAVSPNVIVDITGHARSKANLIEFYQSQFRSRNWSNFSLGLNAWMSRFLPGSGGAERWAEAYLVLPFSDYRAMVKKYFHGSENPYCNENYHAEDI